MEQALEMERAMGLALFDQLKSHPAQARQLLGGPLPAPPAMAGTGTNVLLDSLERASNWVEVRGGETATTLAATGWAWLLAPRDEMAFLELATPPIEALRKAGAGAPLAQVHTELKARLDRVRADLKQRPWICPIASMMSPSSGSAVAKAAVLEARRRLVITAIALRRYELAHRALPAGLQALVPGWLPALPIDPMDGKAIRYRRLDDRRFILYSVGLDGVDAGGEEAGPPSGANRSANLEHGDLLWPEAASAEEIGSAAQRRSRGRLP
jgi:hypothetical protein